MQNPTSDEKESRLMNHDPIYKALETINVRLADIGGRSLTLGTVIVALLTVNWRALRHLLARPARSRARVRHERPGRRFTSCRASCTT